jgi:hypothetical protein
MLGNFRELAKSLMNKHDLFIKHQMIFRSGDVIDCDASDLEIFS